MSKASPFFHQPMKRFQFLHWPLSIFETPAELRKHVFPLKKKRVISIRYPFRLFRYWWAACAILDENKRPGRPPIVVDLGCERGILKRFVPAHDQTRWLGLDWNIDNPLLIEANYDKIYACDFDEPLPLDDNVADIVVCLHVFEHLPRPEFTTSEIKRILRPGGILLAGSPVTPKFAAKLQEAKFKRELAAGTRKRGEHINAFWPKRWKDLVEHQAMKIEFMSGSFFMRWTGSPLENYQWWVRLNQIWGAMFPSLGAELYLQARNIENKAQ